MEELEQRLAAGEIDLLDVREADEFETGSIPGARNVPYRLVREAAGRGAPDRDGLRERPARRGCGERAPGRRRRRTTGARRRRAHVARTRQRLSARPSQLSASR